MKKHIIDINTSRVEYLESLPKDNNGNPIIDEEQMMAVSSVFWELDFLEEITVWDYPEYMQLPK